MKKVVCDFCGCEDVKKEGDSFICSNCGTKYTVEEAKALLKEVEDSKKEGNKKDLNTLYELARRARSTNNYSKAAEYYSEILIQNPNDWEANFYQTYCDIQNCKIMEIGITVERLKNSAVVSIDLISKYIDNEEEKYEKAFEVLNYVYLKANSGFSSAQSWYNSCPFNVRGSFANDMLNYCYPCVDIIYVVTDKIDAVIGMNEQLKNGIITCLKDAIQYHKKLLFHLSYAQAEKNKIELYTNKVRKLDPTYMRPMNPAKKKKIIMWVTIGSIAYIILCILMWAVMSF